MDAQTLANAMGCTLNTATAHVADFNTALIQAGCTTVVRSAMFCAQVGHESVGLRFMEEIWGPTAAQLGYEGRADLGNTRPGDGKLFKGRGPIQLTGRANYGRFGAWAKANQLVADADHFVNNPAAVATSQWGFLAASWYWTVARKINPLADARDILGATKAVNGGTNGLADRTDRWNRCLALGNALLPTGGHRAAPAPDHTPLAVLED
ncbi:MAG TPA: glycoside hydrolase family 19 protein [Amycolatopsis sp.]|nr:glycoside hydrolase family 19 protein [Amycolatopsis sp.]